MNANVLVKKIRAMSDNTIKSHLEIDFGMTHEQLDKMSREELIHEYAVRLIWA